MSPPTSSMQLSSSSPPNSSFPATVTLISNDGFTFVIDKAQAVFASKTLKNILEGHALSSSSADIPMGGLVSASGESNPPSLFHESHDNTITFPNIKGIVLQKICEYISYKSKYANALSDVPEFHIDNDTAIEVMMAADFLDI